MTARINFRRTLLTAVDAFLEGTPTSIERAHRLVERCRAARQFYTLDELVWGGMVSFLLDSYFYEDLPTLHDYHDILARGSNEIHRMYLNHNFRPKFDHIERDWYAQLWEMLDVFDAFPFANATEVIAEYKQRSSAIRELALQSPPPRRLGDETIYHFILRVVTEITTNIGLSLGLLALGRMIPDGHYSAIPPQRPQWLDREPEPQESLAWARKAMRSIVEDGWVLITWQVTRHHYNLSLH